MTRAEFESRLDALLRAHGDWKEGSKTAPPARAAVLAAWDEMASALAEAQSGVDSLAALEREDTSLILRLTDERDAARLALRSVADITRKPRQIDVQVTPPEDLCWCGDEEWPEEHEPYCEAARDALREKQDAHDPGCKDCFWDGHFHHWPNKKRRALSASSCPCECHRAPHRAGGEAMKDPLTKPIEFKPPEEMDRLLRSLIPAGEPEPEYFMVSARVTGEPCAIDGSIVGPACVKCGSHVWMAPSSQKLAAGKRTIACCLPCFMKVTGVEP